MEQEEQALPIVALAEAIRARAGQVPLVISSPTGSGKSTQVPRYCPGRVLLVEPRRVACRALAARVAELEGCELGQQVGYQVRDDACRSDGTRILFVTPGIALRMAEQFASFNVIILDEFHERGMEVDLLFALLRREHRKRLVVMSATLQADRLMAALQAEHLRAYGRLYPVTTAYREEGVLLPTPERLPERILAAIVIAVPSGQDILVFLPGKAEIGAARDRVCAALPQLEVLELHGGLSLAQQGRIFAARGRQRVILATNVAETSLTVPGVGVVIDSGLVRRTRYHHGRGYLALLPIAADSAEQRSGRAGRLGPGHCLRLWSQTAKLEEVTVPEIHRESLSPLVLAAAVCGAEVDDLPFLDPPKPHAVQDAKQELQALGALDGASKLTNAGRELFGLPLDPALGRLLSVARTTDAVHDVVDLVAALSISRSLFERPPKSGDPDRLRADGCDASALIRAVRVGDPSEDPLSMAALRDARDQARRLRVLLGLPKPKAATTAVDRGRLAKVALMADPRCAYITRARKGRVAFSNGGTELELARDSCVGLSEMPPAILAFGARGIADRGRTRMIITCGSPVTLPQLLACDLGRDQLAGALVKGVTGGGSSAALGREIVAVVERVYAKRVLGTREESPRGALARETVLHLLLAGRLGKVLQGAMADVRLAFSHHQLARQLRNRRPRPEADWEGLPPDPGELQTFLLARLAELGVEQPEDVWLLSAADLLPEPLPYDVQQLLSEQYPAVLDMGEARYRLDYDLSRGRVTLLLERGHPSHPPRRQFLPALSGLQIFAEAAGRIHRLL